MLHELLLALLGFAGDILMEDEVRGMQVRPGFDLLTPSERDLLNKLAPLGWLYKQCLGFTQRYEVQWGTQGELQAYRAAMSLGLSDFLEEYTGAVATLETKITEEGPVPLSYVLQHFQRFLISMPAVWEICKDVEGRNLRGCQILDYLAFHRSGIPVIRAVVERLLLRVRVVFLKQSLSWMLYGELNDSKREYFIQYQALPSRGGGRGKLADASQLSFDWSTSYTLKLNQIPESHLSPRLASKIIFIGKAVKLLAFSHANPQDTTSNSAADRELYEYIAGPPSAVKPLPDAVKPADAVNDASTDPSSFGLKQNAFVDAVLAKQFAANGFSPADVERFAQQYKAILQHADQAVEYLELLVNDINDTVSSQLWALLRDSHDFKRFSHCIRNTYLLGKGELFQSVLDNVLLLTQESAPGTPEIDLLLRNNILKAAAERHNLDDESLSALLQMRVNAPSLSIGDFSGDGAVFTGTAALHAHNDANLAYLCTAPRVDITSAFENLWTSILRRPETQGTAMPTSALPVYSCGAIWLPDLKFVTKGFTLSAGFSLDWNAVYAHLSPSHPWLRQDEPVGAGFVARKHIDGKQNVLLGALSCVLHCDKLGPRVVGSGDLGTDIFKSVSIGVSFHAVLRANAIKYFARVFVATSAAGGEAEPLAETVVDLTVSSEEAAAGRKSLRAADAFLLDVEYSREFTAGAFVNESTESLSTLSSTRGGSVSLVLKARIREASPRSTAPVPWDVEVPLDVGSVVKLQGGHSFIGLAGSSLVLTSHASAFTVSIMDAPSSSVASPPKVKSTLSKDVTGADKITKSLVYGIFGVKVNSLSFFGKGALTTYPVSSSYTSTRLPETHTRIDAIVGQLRAWMTLKLQLRIPSLFSIVVDEEAVAGYERLFAFIMKARLIGHALEALWKSKTFAASDRTLCQIRLCMHFFISNLLYFLQEDVVDAEFTSFMRAVDTVTDFQSILKAHRSFVASIVRLAMIDNVVVQEGFERVFQVCLRFIAVSRILNEQQEPETVTEGLRKGKQRTVIIPPEEIESIQKEFSAQAQHLFQIMGKVETRGFIFRLDFNGFLSSMTAGSVATDK